MFLIELDDLEWYFLIFVEALMRIFQCRWLLRQRHKAIDLVDKRDDYAALEDARDPSHDLRTHRDCAVNCGQGSS